MTGIVPGALHAQLVALVRQTHGADAEVRDLGVMEDGHAGQTFGFEVVSAQGAPLGRYVIKLGPAGVVRRGSTDVYRQARLLRVLRAAGLPVPGIAWASPDEQPLGAPYIVMERLPGRTFVIWEPHGVFGRDPLAVRELWRQAAHALAGFHRLDWGKCLDGWEAPSSLADEIERWNTLLRHAPEPIWLEAGRGLAQALSATRPPERSVGLVHGDYQPGNVLYQDGCLVGVIDWDLAGIAPQGIDVGWLLMMSDANAWAEGWKPVAPISREQLLDAYRNGGGTALEDLDWYQAFAHFRMGAIACLNVKLHRNGRRRDALWERFAPSVPTLFARAGILLAADASSERSPLS